MFFLMSVTGIFQERVPRHETAGEAVRDGRRTPRVSGRGVRYRGGHLLPLRVLRPGTLLWDHTHCSTHLAVSRVSGNENTAVRPSVAVNAMKNGM